jgi:hypothetical protein
MSYNLRKLKSSSVLEKLKQSQGYSSDQHALWAGVHALERKAGTRSPTHALADTFQAKLAELDCFLQAFPPLPEQKGLVVLINAEIAGFDLLSLPRAYHSLHSQFIKSYAMDALLEEKPANNFELARERVSVFLEESKATAEKVFAAISLGSDYRFESPTVTGSALVTEETIIHLNLYRN